MSLMYGVEIKLEPRAVEEDAGDGVEEDVGYDLESDNTQYDRQVVAYKIKEEFVIEQNSSSEYVLVHEQQDPGEDNTKSFHQDLETDCQVKVEGHGSENEDMEPREQGDSLLIQVEIKNEKEPCGELGVKEAVPSEGIRVQDPERGEATNGNEHLHVHKTGSGEQLYLCKYCSFANKRKFLVISHTQTHTCAVCNKIYKRTCDLLKHTRTHTHDELSSACRRKRKQWRTQEQSTLVYDYSCDICDHIFSSAYRLYTHKLTHAESRYVCGICDRKFITDNNLIRHNKKLHAGDKP